MPRSGSFARLISRSPAALVLVTTLAGCASISFIPGRRGDDAVTHPLPEARLPASGPPERTARTSEGKPSVSMGRKVVAAKEAPATLIAEGGLRCTVETERFERIKVGDAVLCAWMPDTPR